jgi:hypothetical protein
MVVDPGCKMEFFGRLGRFFHSFVYCTSNPAEIKHASDSVSTSKLLKIDFSAIIGEKFPISTKPTKELLQVFAAVQYSLYEEENGWTK